MNEEIKAMGSDPELEKRDLRRTYNRCGWVLFAFTAFGFVFPRLLDSIFLDAGDEVVKLIGRFLLIYNAFLVGIDTLFAVFLLRFVPKKAPERQKISAKEFIKLVFISFGVSWVGSMISRFFINLLYFFTGIEISDRVSEAISAVEPWQAILCSVLLAPIMEEFLFRKLLIDRLHKHGELVAILTSAVFFGLLHQNVYQIVYATGAGLVLGYLYCKTGSYLAVTALHMIYNLIGVIPTFFTSKLAEFSQMTPEELAALPSELYTQYSSILFGYRVYAVMVLVIDLAGAIILIINRKKFSINNNAPALLESDKREIAWRTPGIVAAAVAMILLTVYSLFV